jgi:hypothetical protein
VLHCWLQAQGRRVLAAQVDDSETGDDEIKQMMSGLDLSAARILQLGRGQLPPQKGVLWLEQAHAAQEWGQLSPGLVVLVAHVTLVRMHFHLTSEFDHLLAASLQWQPEGCINWSLRWSEHKYCCFYHTRNSQKLEFSWSSEHHQASAPISVDAIYIAQVISIGIPLALSLAPINCYVLLATTKPH